MISGRLGDWSWWVPGNSRQSLASSKTLVLVKRDGGVVRLCDLTTGKAETLASPYGARSSGTMVAYSRDGLLLAAAYSDHGIVIWDIGTRKERNRIALEREWVDDMVFIDGNRSLFALILRWFHVVSPGKLERTDALREPTIIHDGGTVSPSCFGPVRDPGLYGAASLNFMRQGQCRKSPRGPGFYRDDK